MVESTHEPGPAARTSLALADGTRIDRMGYGAMQLPGPMIWGPPDDRDNALRVLGTAVDLGINHIDTSAAYGPDTANELIRAALHPYPDGLTIATKVGVSRNDQRMFIPDGHPQRLREQVEADLRTFGLDELDLVYLRIGGDGMIPPDDTPVEESFAALVDLQRAGLVRNLGLSGVDPEQLRHLSAIAPVSAVENRFNLLDRSAVETLRLCERLGIIFVAYFPLAAGMLGAGLDKTTLPPGFAPTDEQDRVLDAIADRHQASRQQVALAWLLATSTITAVIPGTKSLAHLEENVAARSLRLTESDIAQLDAL